MKKASKVPSGRGPSPHDRNERLQVLFVEHHREKCRLVEHLQKSCSKQKSAGRRIVNVCLIARVSILYLTYHFTCRTIWRRRVKNSFSAFMLNGGDYRKRIRKIALGHRTLNNNRLPTQLKEERG